VNAVIFERNKLVGRKVARLVLSVGARATVVDDPAQVAGALDGAHVLWADTFDADLVAELTRARPGLHGVLWTAEPLRRTLRYLIETNAIDHVLARKDFESPPRAWEVVLVARRLAERIAGDAPAPAPLAAYVDWGHASYDLPIAETADRDRAVARVQDIVAALQVPKRIVEQLGELAHELIMNAVYDAPVDASGSPKYARDRKADVQLADGERPSVRVATDGTRFVIQVRDPFGRLERRHVYDGLARGLAGGELDESHGGAGLGMLVCHHATSALFFDVARGRHTEVTAMLELDTNLRELRTQAKSLHFWST
jgi:hypothetical protein